MRIITIWKSAMRQIFRDLALLSLAISILFGTFLGDRALMVPDEGRYAEIPREMVASGDYLAPHLANLKYFEKPPLAYWITALPIKLFGITEWSLRLPIALLGLIGCLFVYLLALELYNRRTALLSALILATSPLYCMMAHVLTPDMPLTVFLTIALGCFIMGTRKPPGSARLWCFLGLYIFAALATLTKGLIGFLLPGFLIFVWILCCNQWRALPSYYLVRGTLVFLLIAVPWHVMIQLNHPEFFHYYFVEQHWLRYFTSYAERGKPIWFLAAVVLIGFFPWWCFLLGSLRYSVQGYSRETLFLGLWALLIFLFFGASNSQLLAYVLPVMPPLAILTARYLDLTWRKSFKAGLTVLMVSLSLIMIPLNLIYDHFDHRSIKPLALQLKPLLKPDTLVIAYRDYYQDLPVYLNRSTQIVNSRGELGFGIDHQTGPSIIWNNATAWKYWQGGARAFMIMSLEEYEQLMQRAHKPLMYPIGRTPQNILLTNQPL